MILAQQVNEAIAGGSASVAAAEKAAYASEKYYTHINAMVEARREANRARVRYDSLRVYAELRRTTEATRRAEMQLT